MLLELLLVGNLMWAGVDASGEATMNVSCDKVEIHHGGMPTANKRRVAFWFIDKRFNHKYLYVKHMPVGPQGQIILKPSTYWVEEIKQQKEITIRIENKEYIFDLTGSYEAINCD